MVATFLAILLSVVGNPLQPLGNEGNQDVASLIDYVQLNAEGLRTYDVLLEIADVIDAPEALTESNTFVRIKVDRDQERCICIHRGRGIKTPLKSGITPALTNQAGIFVIKDGQASFRKHPEPVVSYRAESFGQSLRKNNVPLIELVGIWKFSVAPEGMFDSEFWQSWKRLHVLHGSVVVQNASSILSARIPLTTSTGGASCAFKYEFDNLSMMPLSRRSDIVVERDGKVEYIPDVRERYTWTRKKEVFVPIRLEQDSPTAQKSVEGNRLMVERNLVAKFHWINVNEQFDEKSWDADLHSIEFIHSSTDPVKLGLTR